VAFSAEACTRFYRNTPKELISKPTENIHLTHVQQRQYNQYNLEYSEAFTSKMKSRAAVSSSQYLTYLMMASLAETCNII
jgi:hypothetical protein